MANDSLGLDINPPQRSLPHFPAKSYCMEEVRQRVERIATYISTSANCDEERRLPDDKFLLTMEKYVERTCMEEKSPERSGVTQNSHPDFSVLFKRVR